MFVKLNVHLSMLFTVVVITCISLSHCHPLTYLWDHYLAIENHRDLTYSVPLKSFILHSSVPWSVIRNSRCVCCMFDQNSGVISPVVQQWSYTFFYSVGCVASPCIKTQAQWPQQLMVLCFHNSTWEGYLWHCERYNPVLKTNHAHAWINQFSREIAHLQPHIFVHM
jgi:hypothetical protein